MATFFAFSVHWPHPLLWNINGNEIEYYNEVNAISRL